jgi:hypothetical protein
MKRNDPEMVLAKPNKNAILSFTGNNTSVQFSSSHIYNLGEEGLND